MFLGTHLPRLDDKGRLFLPAKWRHELEPGLVMTKGQERCVIVWPMAEFAATAASLREQAATGKDLRANNRLFFASATDATLDKAGRLTIPQALRDYAGLEHECAVLGSNSRIEIWDNAAWERYLADAEPAFAAGDGEVLPGVM